MTDQEEEEIVTKFLTNKDNIGLSVDLMRFYFDTFYQLEDEGQRRKIPGDLVKMIGELYSTWRQHWGYQLEYEKPQEPLTQQCIRY